MLDKAWSDGIPVTRISEKGGKEVETVFDFDRFFEILSEIQERKASRPSSWFEACHFTGICPKSLMARPDIALALQMYSYCSSGFQMTFPYPDRGYGGQSALWYDVVSIISEAQTSGTRDNKDSI